MKCCGNGLQKSTKPPILNRYFAKANEMYKSILIKKQKSIFIKCSLCL